MLAVGRFDPYSCDGVGAKVALEDQHLKVDQSYFRDVRRILFKCFAESVVQRRYRAIALGHGVVSFFTHTELDGGFLGRFAAGLVASDADMVTDHLERSFGLLQEPMKEKVEGGIGSFIFVTTKF